MENPKDGFNYSENNPWNPNGACIESDWNEMNQIWNEVKSERSHFTHEVASFFIVHKDNKNIYVYQKRLKENIDKKPFGLDKNQIVEILADTNDIYNLMLEQLIEGLTSYPSTNTIDEIAVQMEALTEYYVGNNYMMNWHKLIYEIKYCAQFLLCLSWCGRNSVMDT